MGKKIILYILLSLIIKYSAAQIIVIDAGHNESNIVDCDGTTFSNSDRTAIEVNTNWDVAVRLENMINDYCLGWSVERTRSTFGEYKSISDRENRANTIKRGTTEDVYFLSIHCNAVNTAELWCGGGRTTASGTETFYCNLAYAGNNQDLLDYAQNIYDNTVLYGDWTGRRGGIAMEDDDYYGDCNDLASDPGNPVGAPCTYDGGHLSVLNGLEMPNCLNELGFQDNDNPGKDAEKLVDPTWRHFFAYGYFQALKETFNQEDDLGITALVLPNGDGEFSTNEEIKIRVRNNGNCQIDFGDNPFTFQAEVQGPINNTFEHTINIGGLEPGYEMDITITNSCNMSEPGTYCFNIDIIGGNDGDDTNNSLYQCVNSVPLLTADFSHTLDANTSFKVYFFDHSTPVDKITTWNWDFGDPYNSPSTSTTQNPDYIYSESGTYTVNLEVTDINGNKAAVPKDIIVDNNIQDPLASQFIANPTSGQAPLLVSFNSSNSIGDITGYYWDINPTTGFYFSSGTSETDANPNIIFNKIGDYHVKLNITNGDETAQSAITTIEIPASSYGDVIPNFTYENAYAYAIGKFYDNTSGGCQPYDYEWTFTDPDGYTYTNNLADPAYTFGREGTYRVELCVTAGCGEHKCVTQTIQVSAFSVNASFSGGNITVLPNTTVVFTDQSIPHDEITQWSWYWDWTGELTVADETLWPNNYQQTVEHTYEDEGEYTVALYVGHDNIAGDIETQTLRVATPDYPIDDYFEDQAIGHGYEYTSQSFGSSIAIDNNIVVVGSYEHELKVFEIKEDKTIQPIATLKSSADNGIWGSYHIAIDGDRILAFGTSGLLLFEKESDGWKDMNETYIIDNEMADNDDIDISDNVIVRLHDGDIYVYRKIGASWTNNMTPDILSIYDNEGNKVELWSVAVEENTIVATGRRIPEAYVFEINSEKYLSGLPTATLTMTLPTYSYLKLSVDIENEVIVIGDGAARNFEGIVYIFEKPELGWIDDIENATISPLDFGYTGEEHGDFGKCVAISGNYIAVSAPSDKFIYNDEMRYGSVYIFEKRPGESWIGSSEVIKKINPITNFWSNYAYNIGLSGTNLLVADDSYDSPHDNTGCVYNYKLNEHYSMCYETKIEDNHEFGFSLFPHVFYAGNYILGGTKLVLKRISNRNYRATSITLKEGFHAEPESYFSAKAISCFELENSLSNSKALNIDSKSIDTVDIVKNVTKKFNILNFPELNVELNTGVGKGKKLELVFYNEIEEPYSIFFYKRDSSKISLLYENLSGPKQLLDISTLDEGEYKVKIEISSGVYATKRIHILNK